MRLFDILNEFGYNYHLLEINEFNVYHFINSFKNINYSDTILLTEKFDKEKIVKTGGDYKRKIIDRKIFEIPFTIKY